MFLSFRKNIVIRNGKIVWKHGPNQPFVLYNLSSKKLLESSLLEPASNINKQARGTIKQFKVKGLSSCFVLNLRMSGENCLSFNWHSSRAALGISYFRVTTKVDEYSIN